LVGYGWFLFVVRLFQNSHLFKGWGKLRRAANKQARLNEDFRRSNPTRL
jgi:hypothetical protein